MGFWISDWKSGRRRLVTMIRHRWDISPAEAVTLQKKLASQVRIAPLEREVRTIAGVDCAFSDDGDIIAAAVLCDARTMEILEGTSVRRRCRFPYIPGLLSFREAPAVIEAVRKLTSKPDLLMCDGQGVAHPRGLGLACHVGLWLDVPAVGVAKSRLVGEHRQVAPRRGNRTQLRYKGGIVGSVLRTRDGVKPLYVSVGHRLTFSEAIRWVLRSGRGVRLPEPTRQADQLVAQCKKRMPYTITS